MTATRPEGLRFSQIYLERGDPGFDSERARKRIASIVKEFGAERTLRAIRRLQNEIGAQIQSSGATAFYLAQFLTGASQRDFLDSITEIAISLRTGSYSSDAELFERWLEFARRVFREENLAWEIDDLGGVHPQIDEAFSLQRSELIAGLGAARYDAVRAHLDASYAALTPSTADTGTAIRETFMAAEALFKLVFPKANKLDVGEINNMLKTELAYPSERERDAVKQMLSGIADWVTAAHQYRHADSAISPPSLSTTALSLTIGGGLIRWLIAFDQGQSRTKR